MSTTVTEKTPEIGLEINVDSIETSNTALRGLVARLVTLRHFYFAVLPASIGSLWRSLTKDPLKIFQRAI